MNTDTLVATGAGGLAVTVLNAVYKYLFDTKRVTVEDCDKRHKAEAEACASCKADINERNCTLGHEISAMKGLILLIAVKVGVGHEEMKTLVENHGK